MWHKKERKQLDLHTTRFLSLGVIILFRLFTVGDIDLAATYLLTIELSQRVFGILLILVVHESVQALLSSKWHISKGWFSKVGCWVFRLLGTHARK